MSTTNVETPEAQLEIRAATTEDAKAVAELLGQLGYPVRPEDVPVRMSRVMQTNNAVLVATLNGNVVGLATAHVISPVNRERDVAWLTALVVDERMRGHGVGRALVDAVEAFARERACERLTVTTYEGRVDAHRFYERVGFEHTGRRFGKALT